MGQERGALSLLFFCGQSTAFFSRFPISRRKAGCFLCSVFAWGLGECGVFCNYLLSFSIDWFNEKGKKKGMFRQADAQWNRFLFIFLFFQIGFSRRNNKSNEKKKGEVEQEQFDLVAIVTITVVKFVSLYFVSLEIGDLDQQQPLLLRIYINVSVCGRVFCNYCWLNVRNPVVLYCYGHSFTLFNVLVQVFFLYRLHGTILFCFIKIYTNIYQCLYQKKILLK